MRILLLTDGIAPYEMGGMQKHSFNLAKYLAHAGVSWTLAHCITGKKTFPTEEEVLQKMGLKVGPSHRVHVFAFPSLPPWPGHYIKESYAYSEQLTRFFLPEIQDYDFIFCQGYTGWKWMELKDKGTSIPPVITHFHGIEMFQRTVGWKSHIHKWMLQGVTKWNMIHADATVSLGGKLNRIIENLGVPKQRILTASSGIDEAWFRTDLPNRLPGIKLLFVGRFERRKGLKELIAAYKILIKQGYPLQLSIAGPIPEHLKDRQSGINYYGPVSDESQMQRIMDEHHCLVVPSVSEGMPTVILEGMSRGMAILATDVGATADMVKEDNGWLIEKVTVPALVAALKVVLSESDTQLHNKGTCSLHRVRSEFGWTAVVQRHIQALNLLT